MDPQTTLCARDLRRPPLDSHYQIWYRLNWLCGELSRLLASGGNSSGLLEMCRTSTSFGEALPNWTGRWGCGGFRGSKTMRSKESGRVPDLRRCLDSGASSTLFAAMTSPCGCWR